MKLATLKNGSRDGRLVVVSRDLTRCTDAAFLAPTLQAALDDWQRLAPHLHALAESLEHGSVPSARFHEHDARSPLPRAYQWVAGAAYLNHLELTRQACGVELPPRFRTDPPLYQAASGSFLDPRSPVRGAAEDLGIDLEAGVAVVVDDVGMGAARDESLDRIRLLMTVNGVTLRALVEAELPGGFGMFQSKPSAAFSPVAVTPDELGESWRGGKLHLPLLASVNGKPLGRANAGEDMDFDFGRLIAHAAGTRSLVAGTIIGSGPVSNRLEGAPGRPVSQGGNGYSCLAEQRAVEKILTGGAATPFLHYGDILRIEMKDAGGRSIFGAIEQRIEPYQDRATQELDSAPHKPARGGDA